MIEVVTLSTRAAWLKARQRDVTASVVGCLFGAHEFVSEYELFCIKAGLVPRGDEESPAMRRGRLLEPVAGAMLAEDYPAWKITHNAETRYFRDPAARLGATPDFMVDAPGRGLGVIQTKSVEASVYRRKWFADGEENPEPPFWIVLQTILEAHLTGAQWAAVAPLVIGHGIELPLIEIDLTHMPGVVAAMQERAAAFWDRVERKDPPPVDYARDAALIDRLYQIGDQREEVDLTGDAEVVGLAQQARELREAAKAKEAWAVTCEAAIKAKMGTAEVAHIAGGRTITWKTQKRRGPDGRWITARPLRLPRL